MESPASAMLDLSWMAVVIVLLFLAMLVALPVLEPMLTTVFHANQEHFYQLIPAHVLEPLSWTTLVNARTAMPSVLAVESTPRTFVQVANPKPLSHRTTVSAVLVITWTTTAYAKLAVLTVSPAQVPSVPIVSPVSQIALFKAPLVSVTPATPSTKTTTVWR